MNSTAKAAGDRDDAIAAGPVLSTAIDALDSTIADLDAYTDLDANEASEEFGDILTKEEARKAVESK